MRVPRSSLILTSAARRERLAAMVHSVWGEFPLGDRSGEVAAPCGSPGPTVLVPGCPMVHASPGSGRPAAAPIGTATGGDVGASVGARVGGFVRVAAVVFLFLFFVFFILVSLLLVYLPRRLRLSIFSCSSSAASTCPESPRQLHHLRLLWDPSLGQDRPFSTL